MNTSRVPVLLALLATAFCAACMDEPLVAPDEPLPPVLAVDRPTVQLFRFARGRKVEADTVRLSNNGEASLGGVEQVGGVDYITLARTGWLDSRIEELGDDEAILVLEPSYAQEAQDAADVAEIVLKARNSSDLKRVRVIARTLRGANFEFSVSPLAFAAAPGDSPLTQRLVVRNGGNGTLLIHPPTIRYSGEETGWLSVEPTGGPETAPEFEIRADPGTFSGELLEGFLVFDSRPDEQTRAKPDSVRVQLNVGQPTLAVSTPALSFSVIRGDPNPKPQTLLLSNTGEGDFGALGTLTLGDPEYSDGADGWLEVSLDAPELEVAVDSDGLDAGDYQAAFNLGSANGGEGEIQVELSVEAPVLTPGSRTISFGMVEGDTDPPEPRSVEITNTGSGTFASLGSLSLGAFLPSVTWLQAEMADRAVQLTPTAAATGLSAGDYTTRLPVLSAFGGSDTLTITLSVSQGQDPPSLALSADEVEFSGVSGDPSPGPQTVQVSNAGGGTLGALSLGNITYSGQSGWLAASLSGTTVTLTATTGSLPEGTHEATVPVTSANGGDASIQVSFTVGSPVLTGSASSASFSTTEGGGDPPDQTITFSNTGPGTFSSLGTISVGGVGYSGVGGWLSTSYGSGTLTLSVTLGGLAAGTYEASVPVGSTEGGSVSISVTFTVTRATDAADLVASPLTVRMDAIQGGGDPPSQTVALSNGGGGSLGALGVGGIAYGGGASGWLSASVAGSTLTLDASTGSLTSGSYTATVEVTSANGGNETVDVTFVVSAPELTLSTRSASFSGPEGGSASPVSVSVDLSNTGSGGFSDLGSISLGATSYGGPGGWLTAALAGGDTRVDLSVALGGLGAGTYTATVPVNSAAGGSESISVTLTVAPGADPPVLSLSATAADFFAQEGGGDPAAQNVTLSNSGGGGLSDLGALSLGTITYGTGSGWLSASLAGSTVTLSPTTGSLTAAGGPYTATVPVQSADGGDQDISVTFTVAVAGGAADLQVSPAAVRMDAVAGGSNPPDQEVLLYNGGSDPLGGLSVGAITYSSGSGWLSASLTGSTVTLSADVSGLGAGSYGADVEVESDNGGNETVGVTLEVAGPTLTLSSSDASFSGAEGATASPASISVDLSNTGAGDFASLGTISLGTVSYASGSGWLTPVLAGGNTRVDLSATIGSLSAGVYEATLPVNSTQGGSGSIDVALTVSATAQAPVLALSSSSVAFSAVLGGVSPTPREVTLSNSGGGTAGDLGTLGIGTITYGGGSSGWLSTSSLAGTVLTLSPVTGTLAAGTHTATVPVTSQFGGSQDVAVTVEVGSPVLTASTQALSFTGLEGGSAPATQTVTFSNTGAGSDADLGSVTVGTITYGGGASGWLDEPVTGASVSGGSLDVTVSQSGLGAGSYTATLPVSSDNGGSETLTVTLTVVRETDAPVMVLSATTQRFDALVGGDDPPAQTVQASNAGGGSLGTIQLGSVTYGSGASGWLSASVSGTTITTEASTGTLAKGTYTASLPVSSDGGSEEIQVTFVVGTSRLTLSPRAVSFGDTVGGSGPEAARVSIANTGGGSFASLGTISLASAVYGEGASGWLEATLPAQDTVRLRALTGDLPARSAAYEARVPVLSTLGGSDTIQVAFTVTPGTIPPRLELSLDSMRFSGIVGGEAPPPQEVTGFNAGGGEMGALSVAKIEYGEGAQGWLSGSVTDLTVSLQPEIDGVAGGTHRAHVTIASENGGDGSLEVTLDLASPVLSLSTRSVTFTDTVSSTDTLSSQVFVSNAGAGNRASLGPVSLGTVAFSQGLSGWLLTEPEEGGVVEGFQIGLSGTAATLPEGNWTARVPVLSTWGGADTVAVTFAVRQPDRSFDLPTIQLVKDSVVGGDTISVPLPGDSVVVGPLDQATGETGIRIGVRNGSQTRVNLSGLRVGVPTYPPGEEEGWITGAFLDRTTATFDEPAELFVVIVPTGLPSGRHEGRLVVSSQSPGLEEVAPRVLRVILVVS